MADEEPQGQEEASWWGPDAVADPTLPSTGFDQPLEWPDALVWDEPIAAGGAPQAAGPAPQPEPPAGMDGDFLFPPDLPAGADLGSLPELDIDWRPPPPAGAGETGEAVAADATDDGDVVPDGPLAGLGGGSGWSAAPASAAATGGLAGSIWAEPASGADPLVVTTTMASPSRAVYAETEMGSGGRRRPRFDIRSGNVGVIALISLVSLVLLGMFLSVRSRDDVPTDVSQQQTPSNQIAVTTPLNTVAVNPTTSSTTPGINIAGLIPATETTETTVSAGTAPATTRATTPATTTPATQPTTATSVTPATPAATTTTTLVEPPDDSTSTTTRRATTTTRVSTIPSSNPPPSFCTAFPTISIPGCP